MQFPLVTLFIRSFVVVDSVGHITRLLYFGHHHSFANGMNQTGRNKEYITSLHRHFLKQGFHFTLFEGFKVLLFGAFFGKTNDE